MQSERMKDILGEQNVDDQLKDAVLKEAKRMQEFDTTMIELSEDLVNIRAFIKEAIGKVQAGGKSRERSLVVTKLQEAEHWLTEAIAQEAASG